MQQQTQVKEREYIALDEQIRIAKERQAKGEPGATEQLRKLQQQRADKKHEIRQAGDQDYLDERDAQRKRRNRLERMADCVRGEL